MGFRNSFKKDEKSGKVKHSELKRFARDGIPDQDRGLLWLRLSATQPKQNFLPTINDVNPAMLEGKWAYLLEDSELSDDVNAKIESVKI